MDERVDEEASTHLGVGVARVLLLLLLLGDLLGLLGRAAVAVVGVGVGCGGRRRRAGRKRRGGCGGLRVTLLVGRRRAAGVVRALHGRLEPERDEVDEGGSSS